MLIKYNEARQRREWGRGRRTEKYNRTREATEQWPITENEHIVVEGNSEDKATEMKEKH